MLQSWFFLHVNVWPTRSTTTRHESNGTAIVHTAVISLQIYSDRETTDSVLHLLVLKVILEIGWDVAFNQDPGPIYIGQKSEKIKYK